MNATTELTVMMSVNVDANRFRFFAIEIRPGDAQSRTELVCRWGRIGTEGRTRVRRFRSLETARGARAALIDRREGRGYVVVDAPDARADTLDMICAWARLQLTAERMRQRLAQHVRSLRDPQREAADQLSLPIAS